MLRDELQAIDDPSAVRLATQIDVAAAVLLAAPCMHACGRFALSMTSDRCSSRFRGSWRAGRAAASPSRSNELSIGV
jgi:hypothetical protein